MSSALQRTASLAHSASACRGCARRVPLSQLAIAAEASKEELRLERDEGQAALNELRSAMQAEAEAEAALSAHAAGATRPTSFPAEIDSFNLRRTLG